MTNYLFVFNCNICKGQVNTRYHCRVCEDFDFCCTCYEDSMDKLGLDISTDAPTAKKTSKSAQEARRLLIERCISSLEHYTYCENKNCQLGSCIKMTKVMKHTKSCKKTNNNDCSICKQFIDLCCYHAKACTKPKCMVPYCNYIKTRYREKQAQHRLHQRQILRSRIAAKMAKQGMQSVSSVIQPRPNPMPTPPPSIQTPQKPVNQVVMSQSTAPLPNAMVSTPPLNQPSIDSAAATQAER